MTLWQPKVTEPVSVWLTLIAEEYCSLVLAFRGPHRKTAGCLVRYKSIVVKGRNLRWEFGRSQAGGKS